MDIVQHTQTSNISQLTTFRVADELFGVEALRVQEILPFQKITQVPLAPEYVKGLINLRGQIVTVMDLRRRLGFDALDDESAGANMIVNTEDGSMSVFVDEIRDVLDIQSDRLQPPPGTVRGVAAHYIQTVCQLKDELLIVLNLESLLQFEHANRA